MMHVEKSVFKCFEFELHLAQLKADRDVVKTKTAGDLITFTFIKKYFLASFLKIKYPDVQSGCFII